MPKFKVGDVVYRANIYDENAGQLLEEMTIDKFIIIERNIRSTETSFEVTYLVQEEGYPPVEERYLSKTKTGAIQCLIVIAKELGFKDILAKLEEALKKESKT